MCVRACVRVCACVRACLSECVLSVFTCMCVTSLLLVRMSPNTVCVRACALVLAVVTCPFVITAYSREHE